MLLFTDVLYANGREVAIKYSSSGTKLLYVLPQALSACAVIKFS